MSQPITNVWAAYGLEIGKISPLVEGKEPKNFI